MTLVVNFVVKWSPKNRMAFKWFKDDKYLPFCVGSIVVELKTVAKTPDNWTDKRHCWTLNKSLQQSADIILLGNLFFLSFVNWISYTLFIPKVMFRTFFVLFIVVVVILANLNMYNLHEIFVNWNVIWVFFCILLRQLLHNSITIDHRVYLSLIKSKYVRAMT